MTFSMNNKLKMTNFDTLMLLIIVTMMVAIIPVVYATTVPDPPAKLTSMAGYGEVTLKWLAPVNDGGSPIIGYIIEYSVNDRSWNVFKTEDYTLTGGTVTGLRSYEIYSFRVTAVNDEGNSEPSYVVTEAPKTREDR